MIIEWVFEAMLGWVAWIFDWVPDVELDLPSFAPMVAVAMRLDQILPVHEVIDFITLSIQVIVVIFGFKLAMFVWANIPFKFS